MSRRAVVAAAAAVVSAGVLAGGSPAQAQVACTLPGGNAAQQWDEIAQRTVIGAGALQSEGLVYMAYANTAVHDGIATALGRRTIGPRVRMLAAASPEAAAATAGGETLSSLFPAAAETLRCYQDAALAAVPDGAEKDAGVAAGHAAAANTIAGRIGDGRKPIGTVTPGSPAAGPGVWQPTPPAFAAPQTPWLGEMRPFVLRSPGQFGAPGPLPLTSRQWSRELAEVRALGRDTGSTRTQEQTDIARFWSSNVIAQYNTAFRDVATKHGFGLMRSARLMAVGSMVGADAQMACFNAKYTHWFWRPVTAIGVSDSTWRPLLTTPNHPEYPSAHGCLTGAMSEVFTSALGTSEIDLDVTSSIVATMPTRHFDTAGQLRSEIVNARLWAGLHYRSSSEDGVKLGRKVARYDLARVFTR